MSLEQDLLDFMRETAYKPMTYQELEQHFKAADAEDFRSFLKLLNELEEAGKIIRTRNDRYGVIERMNLVRGRVQAHAKGFAFLIPDEKEHPDVYLHANDLKSAMNGDIALVRVTSQSEGGGRMEGEVVRVVTRAVTQVVGTFDNHDAYGFVLPDDKRINRDIFVPRGQFGGAVSGQKVVVRITAYPEGRAAAQGEVIEILGHKDDPGVDILSIIRKHQLPESFPVDVLAEAEAAPDSITEEEIVQQGRRDLRGETIVTIDGEDAKDLDDAVHVKRLDNGNYLLGVHIADVGYYVRERSALDEEAYRRGCSVYLVDRVIPMLPHRLSNGICSLNPQVDRLTMSCEMEFDATTLKRVRHDVFTSVIRTTERMTYTNVKRLLTATEEEPETELKERYAGLLDLFSLMEELAMRLRKMRMKRGAIDFDFQESKVIVDDQGKPVDIVKRERSIAEMIIEEFMLAANETVAEHFHWLRVPFLYRTHDDPDGEKLMHFMQLVSNFGYVVKGKGNSVHPRSLQTLLEEIRGSKEETVISTMMLRSMKQAKYDAESLGHFGLAAEFYTHFTSPIRRYPDLVIHRVMREVIENGGALTEQRNDTLRARMPEIAQQSSERERVAVDAERDTDKLKKCEFMLDKVGEEFDGLISSVTSFGMFVELDNTVDGLIRLSDLTDDYYHFHELHMALIGERTSKVYRIGDEVKIRVARVNMEDYTIDFEMVDMKPRSGFRGFAEAGGGRGPARKRSGGFGRDDRGGRGGAAASGGSGRGRGASGGGQGAARGEAGRGRGAGGNASGGAGSGRRRKVGGERGTWGLNETGGTQGARDAWGTSEGAASGGAGRGRGRRGGEAEGAGQGARQAWGESGAGRGRGRGRGDGAGEREWSASESGAGRGHSRGRGADGAQGADAAGASQWGAAGDSGGKRGRGRRGGSAPGGEAWSEAPRRVDATSDSAERSSAERDDDGALWSTRPPRAANKGPRVDMWGLPIRGDSNPRRDDGGEGGEGTRRGDGRRGGDNRRGGGGFGGGGQGGRQSSGRRKNTTESGVFSGNRSEGGGPQRSTGAGGAGASAQGSGGSGRPRKKKKSGGGNATAAFVRKKRK
ncbi:ribonuclease R [Paenibacillus curdlanolyticus YK9]|uniref:Ribonuclease R n=1 Tax=Paenibacillus curdlanolyticus YK9 TaxID=717606 RepID=E0ID88_9BACL|nr:ribonuclease R [Paenibacillus curdlanolyticus]EFM09543.1 ribonuclease R [Paenibacillus curdlanolyticus YK9]